MRDGIYTSVGYLVESKFKNEKFMRVIPWKSKWNSVDISKEWNEFKSLEEADSFTRKLERGEQVSGFIRTIVTEEEREALRGRDLSKRLSI